MVGHFILDLPDIINLVFNKDIHTTLSPKVLDEGGDYVFHYLIITEFESFDFSKVRISLV